ncbi:hypothetical protein ACL7TT_12855 [Microbulbifer sp. 2304DJ12-6]|uniref:hypothetical protein n=1 Tax=Microbulbifer sp. 2304DJ12-6 TaxID=3233340 RepID=UPI0039B00744
MAWGNGSERRSLLSEQAFGASWLQPTKNSPRKATNNSRLYMRTSLPEWIFIERQITQSASLLIAD